jgi:hypothetical protein
MNSLFIMIYQPPTPEQLEYGTQKKQIFLQRVHQLLKNVKQWATEAGLQVQPGQVEIREKFTGLYTAPSLSLSFSEQKLAEVVPVSAFVIVADGLLDIKGWGREHIAYLLKDNQSYYPISTDGWYWVEDVAENRAHLMGKQTLLTVVEMVSYYDFQPA